MIFHLAVERFMKRRTGHCGDCSVNYRYVCTDGPLFSFAELRKLPDAISRDRPAGAGIAC